MSLDPNVFRHDETYRGETSTVAPLLSSSPAPAPPPPPPAPPPVIAYQPSQIPQASRQPAPAPAPAPAAASEPQRFSLYVPCPKTNCDQPGCEGCQGVSCDNIFTCTREECELPFPHELEQGRYRDQQNGTCLSW